MKQRRKQAVRGGRHFLGPLEYSPWRRIEAAHDESFFVVAWLMVVVYGELF
jgi:hypothetical protein